VNREELAERETVQEEGEQLCREAVREHRRVVVAIHLGNVMLIF
jgi:predicted translin family RNA/ssDNA-binding protein